MALRRVRQYGYDQPPHAQRRDADHEHLHSPCSGSRLALLLDLKGWIMLPAQLSDDQVLAIRAHLLAGGSTFTGPAQALLDHPSVVTILSELLGSGRHDPECYQFRCENSFPSIRSAGWKPGTTDRPHVVMDARNGGPMTYQCRNGAIYAGLTRVVWELNPVKKGMGGTQFLSGTHKAELSFPHSLRVPDNEHMDSYACPAGSVFIFTESLLHASTAWRDEEHQRVSIFSAYNSVWAQWHRLNLDPAIVETMPKMRQSLFRGTYAHDFQADSPTSGPNRWYSPLNHAL
jgi:hypothetical protein